MSKPSRTRTARINKPRRLEFRAGFAEIGEILACVRDAGAEIPPDLWGGEGIALSAVRERRAQLASGIGWAFTWANLDRDLTDPKRAAGRYARLDDVAKLAAKLVLMLEDEKTAVAPALSSRFSTKTDITLGQIISGLRHLSSSATDERSRLKAEGLHDRAPLQSSRDANTQRLTAGDQLALGLGKAFEEFLGLKVSFPQDAPEDGGNPHGPFVAFVMAVRRHAGIPIVAGSVKSEWTRARNKAREIGED